MRSLKNTKQKRDKSQVRSKTKEETTPARLAPLPRRAPLGAVAVCSCGGSASSATGGAAVAHRWIPRVWREARGGGAEIVRLPPLEALERLIGHDFASSSMAAPCAGLSCTEKTRQHSSARAPVDAVTPTRRSHPEAQRTTCHSHDQVLLVVQVPTRRASRALWRLSSRRGSYAGTHRRAGCSRSEESKALKKASLKHTLACGATKSDQSSSPSVARTCSATRLNIPLQRYCQLATVRACVPSWTV